MSDYIASLLDSRRPGCALPGAFFSDERNSLYGLALLLASYPVYRLTKAYARQN